MDRSKLILLSVSGIFLSLCSYSFVYASAEHCDIAVLEMRNNISGDPMTQVEQLTRIARSWLQEGNTECAVNEVEESAKTARSVKDQVDRAAAGFEIKDVVFQTIQSDTLLPPVLEKRFLTAALQSVDLRGEIFFRSGPDERANDAAFLLRVAKYLDANKRREEAKNAYVLAIRLDQSLPPKSPRLLWRDLLPVMEGRIKSQEFAEVAEMLAPIREDERQNYAFLLHVLRYNDTVSLYQGEHFTRLSPQDLRRELIGLEALLPLLVPLKIPQHVEKAWLQVPYSFLGHGYLMVGDRSQAKNWIDKAIEVVRADDDPISRCRFLVRLAGLLYDINYDRTLAFELFKEAQQIATDYPDSKWQQELNNYITRVGRSRFK